MKAALASALLFAPAANAGPAVDQRLNAICLEIPTAFACAEAIEKHQLSKAAPGVSRAAGRLAIRVANGKEVVLVDQGARYRYIQYLPDIAFHLVHVQHHEKSEMLLVAHADGESYSVPDVPQLSPDGKAIVVVADGISVFELREGKLAAGFVHRPEASASYSFVRWKDAQTIELKKTMAADASKCPAFRFMSLHVLLAREEGRWRFRPDEDSAQCEMTHVT